MYETLQYGLVALLVIASAIFSAWRLLSPALRMRVLDRVSPWLGAVLPDWTAKLRAKTQAQLVGGCGACSHHTPKTPAARRH